MIERDDLVKAVEDRLGFFAGGYAYGLVGEANMEWLKDQTYADLFWFGSIYRLGECAMLHSKVEDWSAEVAQKLVEFLDDTAGLEDYPMVDDDYYSEAVEKAEVRFVEWFASLYKLEESAVWDYIRDNDVYLQVDGDGVYPDWADVDEAVTGIRTISQTWDAHYKSGEFHEPEVCGYCAEASVSA
jgi:hypothetical protein